MAARFLTAVAAALLLISPTVWAQSQPADPPARVGRLSAIEGTVQQRTPDDTDWTAANLNYPISTGFALAPQDGGRAEIQVGSISLRVGPASELDVNNLGDRDASLTLAQGELNLRVARFDTGERIEIVTPRGVMEVLAAGEYHIDAGTTESPTRFEVFNGQAELQRDGGNTALASGQAALINTDDARSLTMAAVEPDALDQWAFGRDGRGAAPPVNTASRLPPAAAAAPAPYGAPPPYVSPEMTGAADLSAYGDWNTDPQYGAVWHPSGVPADWAPYTYGHWAWVSPWGWTWIDDEPWGFAPFHYGRWAYADDRWGWVPGEFAEAPVYAPALVVFFGGPERHFFYDGYREGIGWCPLGPREVFVPGYQTSIAYVRNVNITNVNINQVNITRVNNTVVVNNDRHWEAGNYANHRFATVVPANSFAQARNIHEVAARPTQTAAIAHLPVAHDPAVAPPRTAAVNAGSASNAALFNRDRGGRPQIPAGRAGSTPGQPNQTGAAGVAGGPTNRFAAGRTPPVVPPAQGGAALNNRATANTPGNGAPDSLQGARRGPFGAGAPNAAAANGRGLPPLPPAHGGATAGNRTTGAAGTPQVNGAPDSLQGTRRGPFGAGAPNTPAVNGHGLPPVPSAHGGPTAANRAAGAPGTPQGNSAPNSLQSVRPTAGPLGMGNRNVTSNAAGRNLPALPPAHGEAAVNNRAGGAAPQGNGSNPTTQASRGPRGPFGTNTPAAPNVATGSAGQGLRDLPTNRQQMQRPPVPQAHIAQPPTLPTGSSAGHRGFAAPATPSPQQNVAAPTRNVAPPPRPQPQTQTAAPTRSFAPPPQPPAQTAAPARNFAPPPRPQPQTQTAAPARNFAPPPRPQAPAQTAAPARNFAPPPRPQPPAPQPHIAAPVHSAPPPAPARPVANAAASHAPAPAPHPQPAPQHAAPTNNKKQNQ